jgi:hypothetical protein
MPGWGQGGEMTQALYAHMNNKTIKIKKDAPLHILIAPKCILQLIEFYNLTGKNFF